MEVLDELRREVLQKATAYATEKGVELLESYPDDTVGLGEINTFPNWEVDQVLGYEPIEAGIIQNHESKLYPVALIKFVVRGAAEQVREMEATVRQKLKYHLPYWNRYVLGYTNRGGFLGFGRKHDVCPPDRELEKMMAEIQEKTFPVGEFRDSLALGWRTVVS